MIDTKPHQKFEKNFGEMDWLLLSIWVGIIFLTMLCIISVNRGKRVFLACWGTPKTP
jgi:hypothetical protein